MGADCSRTFKAVGEFTVWMGAADSSADEMLGVIVEQFGRDVAVVPSYKSDEPLTEFPKNLNDRICTVEALMKALCTKPPNWQKVACCKATLVDTMKGVSEARNAIFHGQLQGQIGEEDVISRRYQWGFEKKKIVQQKAVNFTMNEKILLDAVGHLKMICVFFELCHASLFWDAEGWPKWRTSFHFLQQLDLDNYKNRHIAGEFV